MKASVSPVAALAGAVSALVLAASAQADVIVQKDGQRREGEITSVQGGNIRLKVGPAETAVPLTNVASVSKDAPKAFNDALKVWETGEPKAAVAALKPFVDRFIGLPTPWAARAAALLGDAYLAAGDIPSAEASFAAFQRNYPDDVQLATVGLAGLAVAKKDFSSARDKLAPIVDIAYKTTIAPSGDSATFGKALFLMAQVNEAAGENQEALRNYILASTVFREDEAIAAKSGERAKALEAEKVVVP